MITFDELKKLIENSEKENSKIELKSFRKLYESKEGSKDIARGIVALANRHGGRFIMGINDDGKFDGKLPIMSNSTEITIDDFKEKIFHLIRDHISPTIEPETEYLQCSEGDVLIINVPKRKGMPHAFIEKREGSQIKNRAYYIRTPHGITLVSDHQLEWLFQNQNSPDFSQDFRISLEFNPSFQLAITGFIIPLSNHIFAHMIMALEEDKKTTMFNNINEFSGFISQVFPFAIIQSLAQYFIHGWYVGWEARFDRRSSGYRVTDRVLTSDTIRIDEIPIIGKPSNSIELDLHKYINDWQIKPFKVPSGTKISISYEGGPKRSMITFKHPAFKFEIYCGMLSCGMGLHPKNPYSEIFSDRKPKLSEEIKNIIRYFDGGCQFVAKFDFPDNDFELFDIYLHYSNAIKTHLCYEWDIQEPLSRWPDYRILEINYKIDDILSALNITSQNEG